MSRAVLGAFALGIVLASGVTYLMTRGSQPQPQPAAQFQQAVPATPAVEQTPATEPAPAVSKERSARERKPSPTGVRNRSNQAPAPPVETAQNLPPAAPAPAPTPVPAPAPAAPVEQPAPVQAVEPVHQEPPPRTPHSVTLPAGTTVNVRLGDALSSDRNQSGDQFNATLDSAIVIDGMVIAERGARVQGRVLESTKAGRVKGLSHISLQLVQLSTSDGQKVPILTSPYQKDGQSSVKEDVAKTGAVAALGAVIGALAGGGKGAAIGAGAGGAAGAGGTLATRGKAVVLPVETRISFRLSEPVTLTEKLR